MAWLVRKKPLSNGSHYCFPALYEPTGNDYGPFPTRYEAYEFMRIMLGEHDVYTRRGLDRDRESRDPT